MLKECNKNLCDIIRSAVKSVKPSIMTFNAVIFPFSGFGEGDDLKNLAFWSIKKILSWWEKRLILILSTFFPLFVCIYVDCLPLCG